MIIKALIPYLAFQIWFFCIFSFIPVVLYVKYQHTNDKLPLKGAWSGSCNQFGAPKNISETDELRVAKFCMQLEYIKC